MEYEQRSHSRRRRTRAASPVHSYPPPPAAPPPPPSAPIPHLSSTTPLSLNTMTKKKTPYSIQRDFRVLEREKRVTTILNNERFRAELENILQGQKDGLAQPRKTNLQKLQDEASSSASPSRVTKATGVVGSTAAAVIPIDDLRGVSGSKYTVAERQARCKLAAVYRLVEMFGWSQIIYNSITACSPSEDHSILVNPFGLLYSEVTASSLMGVDLEARVVDPGSTQLGINEPGFGLHAAIHAARRDVKCVVHVHTNAGVAVSSMNCGLLPISEEALSLGGISYHDGLHLSAKELRQQIAQDLGPKNKVLILRNHGLVAMGNSIEEAFHITHKAVKACEIQVSAMSVGLNNIIQCSKGVWSKSRVCLGGADVESTFTIFDSISRRWGPGELEFEALMRMLDNKGYNTGYRYKGLSLLESGTGSFGTWKRHNESVDSTTDHEDGWSFLDQKKIDRTEPVIRNRATPRRHRETRSEAKHKQAAPVSPVEDSQRQGTPLHSTITDSGLSPLAKAELTASRVAESTGRAVERLAKDHSILKQSPHTHTPSPHSQHTPSPDSTHLSPLERTQHTAERVARSTGHAVKQLAQDLSTRNLKDARFPSNERNGDLLETSSEPFLLAGGHMHNFHHPTRLKHTNRHSSSLRNLTPKEPETSTPYSKGHTGLHHSLGDLNFPDGLSPLEKVTHTAERVAGSTGVAVAKLSNSLTTTS